MLKIDHALLDTIGLSALPPEEKKNILQHMYDTLEIRVGARMAEQMSDKQLTEFEQYFEAKDDKGAFNFLQTHFPNYKVLVHDEFNKLKNEVAAAAPQILAEANSRSANDQYSPQMPASNPAPAPQTFDSQPYQTQAPAPPQTANQPETYQTPTQTSNQSQTYQPVPSSYQPPQSTQQPPMQPDFPTEQPPAGPQNPS